MEIDGHDIGVCSWSLRLEGFDQVAAVVEQLGLAHLQLALGPLLFLDDKRKFQELGHLRAAKLTITAGMIAFPGENYDTIALIRQTGGYLPDATWPIRKQLTVAAGKLAAELELKLLSTHIGFIPPSSHEDYGKLVDRVSEVAAALAPLGVTLLTETGQEEAPTLLQFLNDLSQRNVGVNFDPANMILYGAGDPIAAIRTLDRHIRHVHVKDAVASSQPGITWGQEVPFGVGQVPHAEFLLALKEIGYTGPLAIECEAGADRVACIKTGLETLGSVARVEPN